MFGIGLPEMIVIFAVALIVVGPDKLPGLARSLAKGLMEMKKTLNQVKDNLTQEGEVLDSVHKDLKKTADELRGKMIDADPSAWELPPAEPAKESTDPDVIDVQPVAAPPRNEIQPTADAPAVETAETTGTEPDAADQQPAGISQETHQVVPPEKQHD